MNKPVAILLCSFSLGLVSVQLVADPYVGYFAGEFEGSDYRVTIEQVNSTTYDGILTIDGERMQLDARRYGDNLNGLLRSHTQQFGFRGRIAGGILILDTEDGRHLILRRGNPD